MHKHNTLPLPVWALMALLIGMLCCSDDRQLPPVPKGAGVRARDFVLKDLSGRKFTLGEQRGKPVLIIFTTTWCPTCRSEIPRYKKIHNDYAARGLVVINIDIEEPQERVSLFAEKYQLPYRVLLDDKGLVAEAYQIVGVPAMILIDPNGVMMSRQYHAIEGMLEKLFRH